MTHRRAQMKRSLSYCLLVSAAFGAMVAGCAADAPGRLTLAGKDVFLESPRPGVRVTAYAFYCRTNGTDMISRSGEQTRSDVHDVTWQRFSDNNGKTWSPPTAISTFKKLEKGTFRRYLCPGFVDPGTGMLITMILQGTLPNDSPLEGMKHWTLRYALSRDGGRSFYREAPVIQAGPEYCAEHPLPGVWLGKNGIMIGDTTCMPIRIRTGEILQPVQICPVGPDGEYYNPGGGYTYHDSAVLIGRWNKGGPLDWRLSSLVKADPARSTRGMLEPTIAEMPDGRILMVLRGSNDRKPSLPGYRWYAVSTDHGQTWSEPKPWTYTDGQPFFSPSSCSQLLRHSNGRIYWIGNICDTNPKGNLPRHPLLIGEVDRKSMLLIRETLCPIDERVPGDPETLQLSNFHAREDRVTHEIVVHCSPFGRGGRVLTTQSATKPARRQLDWTSDAYVYRIRVTTP